MLQTQINVAELARFLRVGKFAADLLSAFCQFFSGKSRETKSFHLAVDHPELKPNTGFFPGLERYRTILPLRRIHEVPSTSALDHVSVGIDDQGVRYRFHKVFLRRPKIHPHTN